MESASKVQENMEHCKMILKELMSKKNESFNWPFLKPVDVNAWGLRNYFDIVKQPMDLGTIKKRLENCEFKTPEEFASAVRQVCLNCFMYNPPDNPIHRLGAQLLKLFEAKWNIYLKLIEPYTETGYNLAASSGYVEQSPRSELANLFEHSESKADTGHHVDTDEKFSSHEKEDEFVLSVSAEHEDDDDQIDRIISEVNSQLREHLEMSLKLHDMLKKWDALKIQRIRARMNNNDVPSIPDELWNNSILTSLTAEVLLPKPAEEVSIDRLSYKEIRQLSLDINKLPGDKLSDIFAIITRHETLTDVNAEEFEIDFEVMQSATLKELREYVSTNFRDLHSTAH